MSKGGNGIGSASIVLIFAVLCMTIFSLISLQTALADKALTERQEGFFKEYYAADTQAEIFLSRLLSLNEIPETLDGIEVACTENPDFTQTIRFAYPINDLRELSVEVVASFNGIEVLEWRVQDEGLWEISDELPVWGGEDVWEEDAPLFSGGGNPWD